MIVYYPKSNMDYLKQKSQQNELAADFLKGKEFYSSSVHCSYYSSFQLTKKMLITYYKNEIEIKNEISIGKANTHKFYILKLENEIAKHAYLKAREFKQKIRELKKMREIADYEDKAVIEYDSVKAIKLNTEIQKIINKVFNG